jgi:P27 family predicted phage terminase small subunit
MPRGRTAVPEHVKRNKNGVPYKDPVTPDCPEWLSQDARAEWERLEPVIVERGLLGRVDRSAFAIYCQLVGIWKLTSEVMNSQELITAGCEGQPKLNPLARYQAEVMDRIRQFSEQFGFTPASRNKIDASAENEEASELDKFLQGAALADDREER